MRIGEYLRESDIDTYKKLKRVRKSKRKKKNKIELGDRPENLMKHDAYKRVRGRLRQIKWGC